MKSILRFLFLAIFLGISTGWAAVDDLLITEVDLATGQAEVTNLGLDFTTTSNLPFCHRFNYSSRIPSGTTFAAGESKLFQLPGLNATDSDFWLYRNSSFGNAANIISGLKWGTSSGVGREPLASGGGKWDGVFLPVPGAGQTLQLTDPEQPDSASSWTVAAANLGQFQTASPILLTMQSVTGNVARLEWTGGTPPFLVEQTTSLGTNVFEDISGPISSNSFTVTTTEPRMMFRVTTSSTTSAPPPSVASFEVTFTSLWSRNVFATVPSNDHFSRLVGATHDGATHLWQAGGAATPGVELMAETGTTVLLDGEIDALIGSTAAGVRINGSGVGVATDSTTVEFDASIDHPYLTLVSMIAPSPDWFVGIDGASLLDADGQWHDSLTFDLVAYDSGTDAGTTFSSPNQDNDEPIFMIPATDSNFLPLNGAPGNPIPIASFEIRRL